jgi:DnaJ family protein C protein 19
MFPLAAGVVALIIGVVIFASISRAGSGVLARRLKRPSVILLLVATIGLLATGRAGLAVLTGSIAWAILSGVLLPDTPRPPEGGNAGSQTDAPRRGGRMTRAEALSVLGLSEEASEADIRAAHRRLIQQIHPDRGGTNYLAAKINDAKDVLLGK